MQRVSDAPLRPVSLGPVAATVERRGDGSILLRRDQPLGRYPDKLTERLRHWTAVRPDHVFLAEPAAGGWNRLTYGEALDKIRSIGQFLLERGLSAERPLAILSENSIENALLALGAMYVGIPCAPISPSYSLLSKGFEKLRHIVALLQPGLVFAADDRYAGGVQAVLPADTEVLLGRGGISGRGWVTAYSAALNTRATADVDDAFARVTPDTIAKLLFTSGSTGMPKGVPLAQRMVCANQQAIAQTFTFLTETPPVFVDWLPWHHTFGGNNNFGMTIYHGGSLYIDQGKPLPGLIEATVRALRDISPTFYMTVPKAAEVLLPFLQKDAKLRESLFARVQATMFGGAAIPAHMLNSLQEMAVRTVGQRITNVGVIGSTEVGPCATFANWHIGDSPAIGIPVAGMQAKIAPVGAKLELRLRGPAMLKGYWKDPARTATAFDEEGYFRIGDAVLPADPGAQGRDMPDWGRGMLFNGRIAEDFKLVSGTWVNVAAVRDRFIDLCAPYARDVVIAGHGRDYVAAMLFLNLDACRGLCRELAADAPHEAVAAHPAVRAKFAERLGAQDREGGSSERILRLVIEAELPSLDNGELTDKNSVSQRAVLERRTHVVEELFSEQPGERVLESPSPAGRGIGVKENLK